MRANEISSKLNEFAVQSSDPAEDSLHGKFLAIGGSSLYNQLSADTQFVAFLETSGQIMVQPL